MIRSEKSSLERLATHLQRELKTRPEVDQGPAGIEVDVISVVHPVLM